MCACEVLADTIAHPRFPLAAELCVRIPPTPNFPGSFLRRFCVHMAEGRGRVVFCLLWCPSVCHPLLVLNLFNLVTYIRRMFLVSCEFLPTFTCLCWQVSRLQPIVLPRVCVSLFWPSHTLISWTQLKSKGKHAPEGAAVPLGITSRTLLVVRVQRHFKWCSSRPATKGNVKSL